MCRFIISIFIFCISLSTSAQIINQIDATLIDTSVQRGHLDLGGANCKGDSISVNNLYLERNTKAFMPVIGEFHYSRFPNPYWEEEIQKMKAGGITIVATYVFWNLHEFKEGQFDWQGDLNLRKFVELCAKNKIEVLMRIGPFAHGEMRNGGLPDWLYGRPIEVRTNDPAYLTYVKRFYTEIGQQLNGLMFKEGGPVVGIQIENEYQHSAAPWGFGYMDAPRERTVGRRDTKITQDGVGINSDGNEFANVGHDHMKTLKKMAIDAGLVAPIYTATGWGRATIVEKGSIPVMAGYAYPFWTASNKPSPFYLFKDIRLNPDYSPVSYDVNLYPSLAAELGTGMAITYSRRPKVIGESFLPLMVRTVGSGSNGLGYYMYHGGNTPSYGNYFMSEGWGLNNKSYDYQAPIGEYGQISAGFYGLKRINYFLKDFGSELAKFVTLLPSNIDEITPENLTLLRYAVRSDGYSGYLFMHNFQDHLNTKDLEDLQVDIKTKSGMVQFPASGTFTLKAGKSAIFPFNLGLGDLNVEMATVQPFCRFSNRGVNYTVFVAIDGIEPTLMFNGKVKISGDNVKTFKVNESTIVRLKSGAVSELQVNDQVLLILPQNVADDAYLCEKNGDKNLIVSENLVLVNGNKLELVGKNATSLKIFPVVNNLRASTAQVRKMATPLKSMSQFNISIPEVHPEIQLIQTDDRHFTLKAENMDWSKVNDIFLTFNYTGDRAVCMMNGELQADNLYNGTLWKVGLKRYADQLKTNPMYFYFIPMQKDAPYLGYLDKNQTPDFGSRKEFLKIGKPEITVEYKINIEY